jgi:hypothetical protein
VDANGIVNSEDERASELRFPDPGLPPRAKIDRPACGAALEIIGHDETLIPHTSSLVWDLDSGPVMPNRDEQLERQQLGRQAPSGQHMSAA